MLTISALCHAYLWWRIVGVFPGGGGVRLLLSLVFVGLFALGLAAVRSLGDGARTGWRKLVVSSFYFWFMMVLLGCVLFATRDAIWWIGGAAERVFDVVLLPPPEERARWLHRCNLLLLTALFLLGAWGYYSARRTPRLRQVTARLAELPSELDGLRIVHLTDLHVGPYIPRKFLAKVVVRTCRENPDIVAITGDLVDGPVAVWADATEPLRSLEPRLGTFVTLGNHDYYAGAEEWIDRFSELGAKVLVNSSVRVEVGSASFRVAGITDPVADRALPEQSPDLEAALADAEVGDFTVLLSHRPDAVEEARQRGVNLQLSGHTHGGQVFPFGLLARRHQAGFLAGLYDVGQTKLYVSRGVGFWGPAMRLFAPSEIAVITLRATSQTWTDHPTDLTCR